MLNPDTIITFGVHRGKPLSDESVPLSYVKWIASRGNYTEPGNRFAIAWKVPIGLMVHARREWESRTGERWVS
jgi:hypothetical protein